MVDVVKLRAVESRALAKSEDSTFVKELAVLVFGHKTLYNSSISERLYTKADTNDSKKPRRMLDKNIVEEIRRKELKLSLLLETLK